MEYYVVCEKLGDNNCTSWDFNKECNRVDYKDPNYIAFKHEYKINNKISGVKLLALIPHTKVFSVGLVKE